MLNQLITKNFVDGVYETAVYTAENNDNVTRYGVEKMLEMWAQNKANLYEFLGNNLKISTTYLSDATFVDFERELDDFYRAFIKGFETKKDGLVKLQVLHQLEESHCFGFTMPTHYLRSYIAVARNFESVKANKVLEMSNELRSIKEILGLKRDFVGKKVTKMMREVLVATVEKLFTNNYISEEQRVRGLYECDVVCQYYSRIVEKIGVYKSEHTVWLSIDPNDFMRCSHGYDWESCHVLGNMHGDGAIQYCVNGTAMIAYEEKTGDDYVVAPLTWRQIIYTNHEFSRFVGSRQYKSCNEKNAEAIRKMVIDCMEKYTQGYIKEDGWDVVNYSTEGCNTQNIIRDYVLTGICNYAYNDIRLYSGISHHIWMMTNDDSADNIIVNSEDEIVCLDCGEKFEGHRDYFYMCESCGGGVWCEDCQEYHDEDDMNWVESVDRYVCNHCLENEYYYCEHCGEYYPNGDATYVEDACGCVCEDCLSWHYAYCENCGEYHSDDNVNCYKSENGVEYWICDDCKDDCVRYCEECGEETYGSHAEKCYYCDTCFDECEDEE